MSDWVFPEDTGTGGHVAGGDHDDAANFAAAFHAIGGTDFVVEEIDFELDRPVSDPVLDIDPFKAVMSGSQAVASQSGELRSLGVSFVAEVDARSAIALTDSAVNHVFAVIDLDTDDTVNIEVNTSGEEPASPSLKILEVDTTTDTVVRTNTAPREGASPSRAISEGQVFSDEGTIHETIAGALDVSETYVFIGPGTFEENIEVDQNDIVIEGMSTDTVIDGGATGDAIRVTGSNVTIRDLTVQTDSGTGRTDAGVAVTAGTDNTHLLGLIVNDASGSAIRIFGGVGTHVERVKINACDQHGVFVSEPSLYARFTGVTMSDDSQVTRDGFRVVGAYSRIDNCLIDGPGENGITFENLANSNVTTGNLIRLAGATGIEDNGTNNAFAGNRIVSSVGQNTDFSNQTTQGTIDEWGNLVGV